MVCLLKLLLTGVQLTYRLYAGFDPAKVPTLKDFHHINFTGNRKNTLSWNFIK